VQALYCDEAMDAVEDLLHQIVQTFGLKGHELKAAREKLASGWISIYVKGLAEILERAGGEYFADNRLTVADLKVFVQIRSLRAGTLDHIPTDLVDKLAPGLVKHEERVGNDPIVTAYYAARAS
jgi:glutathione S-transferase